MLGITTSSAGDDLGSQANASGPDNNVTVGLSPPSFLALIGRFTKAERGLGPL